MHSGWDRLPSRGHGGGSKMLPGVTGHPREGLLDSPGVPGAQGAQRSARSSCRQKARQGRFLYPSGRKGTPFVKWILYWALVQGSHTHLGPGNLQTQSWEAEGEGQGPSPGGCPPGRPHRPWDRTPSLTTKQALSMAKPSMARGAATGQGVAPKSEALATPLMGPSQVLQPAPGPLG